ncbi:MAG: LolA-related protein [Paraburkholderia sp.]|uniref:LolA-related protein n=1 Tax=Burkholderiaceae TaxID=119060 RepID=UPI0010F7855B|nr:LolA-related protein [Burkholderia sp. 4M9327F10]
MTATRPVFRVALHRRVRALACAAAFSAWAATALLTCAHAASPDTSGWTLERLMSTLGQKKSGHASFVETKYLSIATEPVKSSGELMFTAPDHLEKRTESPTPEDLMVDGDKLTIARNGHRYTLALTQYPDLSAFIDSIRATLAGNRFALEQVYKVAVTGAGDDWTLTLTPLDTRMLKKISTITLTGTRDQLNTVAIQQADGDHSLMRLQNDAAN